jgi:hypothetical protein
VPAKGFQVTVGKCPDGFKQTIPNEANSFIPLKDCTYSIQIETDAPNVYPGNIYWTAE